MRFFIGLCCLILVPFASAEAEIVEQSLPQVDAFEDYDARGLLFALAACQRGQSSFVGADKVITSGNVEKHTGIMAELKRNVCMVDVINEVKNAENLLQDYSLRCNVSDVYWPQLLGNYKHLISDFGWQENIDKNGILHTSGVRYTGETEEADEDLLTKLREGEFCFPKPPTDEAKIEIEQVLYRENPEKK